MHFLLRYRRVLIPLALAPLCLALSTAVPPVAAWLLIMAGVALMFDSGLAMMPTTGGLNSHKQ